MHPVFLRLGPLVIPTYGVLMALGYLAGIWAAAKKAEERKLDGEVVSNLFVLLVLSSLAGSRILYVLLNLDYFLAHPLRVVALWRGGLVFFGGFLLAVPLGIWYLRRNGVSVAVMADVVAPSLALGHVFGRLGCFAYGCCYGCATTVPWAVHFPGDPLTGRHPTQLYEAAAEFVIFLGLSWYYRRPHRTGDVMIWYLVAYSVFRFFVEFIRDDERGGTFLWGLSIAQNTSVLLVLAALAFFVGRRFIRPRAGIDDRA